MLFNKNAFIVAGDFDAALKSNACPDQVNLISVGHHFHKNGFQRVFGIVEMQIDLPMEVSSEIAVRGLHNSSTIRARRV